MSLVIRIFGKVYLYMWTQYDVHVRCTHAHALCYVLVMV
jgi:hypothetical protein